ncbi:carbohydrate ABC transporter permease [Pedococcus sp. 5OH_020]|uniref:carbohydrate ABC transporter permease n=1 Tax=Pedococcus sp. 5OH_020 TaxID=2989814 RepID=UPI0022E9A67A|nr:carbohydrate ABC transporter permease [Pedococcus sp. 5OH_020]
MSDDVMTPQGHTLPEAPIASRRLARAGNQLPTSVRVKRLAEGAVRHLILLVIAVFAIGPLLWAISSAFKSDSEIMTGLNIIPAHPTLQHFRVVLEQSQFVTWFKNSLLVAGGTTLLAIAIGSLGGYAMSRWRFRGHALYGNSLLVVQMFPGVMLAIPLYLLLTKYHLIDTLWALLVTYLTFALAFSVWMLKGYFDGIPKEMEEAALIDGAGRLRILWSIILPLARPGIVSVAVFAFLLAWNEFFFAYVFIASNHNFTLSLGMYSFIEQFSTQWGNIMAAGTLATLPVLVFFFLLQRALTRGMMAGATKG